MGFLGVAVKLRSIVLVTGLMFGLCSVTQAQVSTAQGQINKLAVKVLPVMPWLIVGSSKLNQVSARLEQMKVVSISGVFAHTGGPLINAVHPIGDLFPGEEGLRIASLGFEKDNHLVSVVFVVERGFQSKNIEPLIRRMESRYSSMAQPIRVGDDRGDNKDRYVLFDLGRYTVEILIPQHGQRARVIFATREIYEEMKRADRTGDLLLPRLAPL